MLTARMRVASEMRGRHHLRRGRRSLSSQTRFHRTSQTLQGSRMAPLDFLLPGALFLGFSAVFLQHFFGFFGCGGCFLRPLFLFSQRSLGSSVFPICGQNRLCFLQSGLLLSLRAPGGSVRAESCQRTAFGRLL